MLSQVSCGFWTDDISRNYNLINIAERLKLQKGVTEAELREKEVKELQDILAQVGGYDKIGIDDVYAVPCHLSSIQYL